MPGVALSADRYDEVDPGVQCRKWCGDSDKPCELIRFMGFSPDNERVGYVHLKCPGKLEKKKKRMTYNLMRLRKGKRKLGVEVVTPEKKIYPGWFKRQGFVLNELPGVEKDGFREYDAGRGQTVRFYWKTEQKVAYYVEVLRDGRQVFSRRYEFDEIYFGMTPRVYLSPNLQKIALVLALDAMVKIDAGVAFFSLNP